MSEVLTKGCYHIAIAKQYLEAFEVECRKEAKRQAKLWVGKVDFLLNDVYSRLTPKGRELFKEEILRGDTLFFENISEMILKLNPDQREALEQLLTAMMKGETIKVIQDGDTNY